MKEQRLDFLTGRLRMELRGRLGNQLFTWATGYSVSTDLNLKFCMSDRTVRGNVDLLDLDLRTPMCRDSTLSDLYRRSQMLKAFRLQTGLGAVIEERSHEYDSSVMAARPTQTLRGYFQSWRYFDHPRGEISKRVSSLHSPSSAFRAVLSQLTGANWVAVHVRGGEYRQKRDTFIQLGRDYYGAAMDLVNGEIGKSRVVLFSDDIEYAREVVPYFAKTVSSEDIASPAERLVLSMLADALIGANSTFSWWAAYGASKRSGLNVFPSNWFVADWLSERDLIYPDWVTIPA